METVMEMKMEMKLGMEMEMGYLQNRRSIVHIHAECVATKTRFQQQIERELLLK